VAAGREVGTIILFLFMLSPAVAAAQENRDTSTTPIIYDPAFLSVQLDVVYDADPAGPIWRVGVDLDMLHYSLLPNVSAGVRLGLEYNAGDGFDFAYFDLHYNALLRLTAIYSIVRMDVYSGYALVDRSEVRTDYNHLKFGADLRVALLPRLITAVASYNRPLLGLSEGSIDDFTTWSIGLAVGWQP
jgi:hypothetical protein